MKIYNFWFWLSCHSTKFEQFKFWIFKNDKFKPNFEIQNDFSLKSDEHQSCSTRRSITFILVISSFDKVLVHIVHKTYISLMSFMKPYERYINFVNNVITTLLNRQMNKIKVKDLDELFNFSIHHFFRWNHLEFKNLVWSCLFLKFQNLNCPNYVTRKDW
jgi:hypothetical protein